MITILMGPEAGAQARVWASRDVPPLWFAYDDPRPNPGAITLRGPGYQALAAYAQRLLHPTGGITEMTVTDISAFRKGTPSRRHPEAVDFAHDPDLARISKMVKDGLGSYTRMIFASGSRLYEQILTEVATGLGTDRKERVLEFGQSLASEALTHLVWDLNSAGIGLVLTAWDVRVGTRQLPRLPQSTVRMADHLLWCENSRMSVLESLAGSPVSMNVSWDQLEEISYDYPQGQRSLLRSGIGETCSS